MKYNGLYIFVVYHCYMWCGIIWCLERDGRA